MKEQIEEMAKDIASTPIGTVKPDLTFTEMGDVYKGEFIMRIAKHLYNADYRKQEWISVEERLPEECKNVLCFDGSKTIIAFMEKTEDCGEYVPVFWDFVAYDRDDTYDEVCATHWMPLPQPPKMKGGAE